MAHVRDGTSKTAMVLEVSDERAVIWSRPDDFEPDKDEPLKGVAGLREGRFLVLFADASVRALSESISKETARAIFTRVSRWRRAPTRSMSPQRRPSPCTS